MLLMFGLVGLVSMLLEVQNVEEIFSISQRLNMDGSSKYFGICGPGASEHR